MSARTLDTAGSSSPSTRRRRRALAVALVALAVLPQCCCCVVPLGYGPQVVPGLHRVVPPGTSRSLTSVSVPGR